MLVIGCDMALVWCRWSLQWRQSAKQFMSGCLSGLSSESTVRLIGLNAKDPHSLAFWTLLDLRSSRSVWCLVYFWRVRCVYKLG